MAAAPNEFIDKGREATNQTKYPYLDNDASKESDKMYRVWTNIGVQASH